MKILFSLSFCCFLLVLSGLMTSCGKPTSKQEPAAIPAEPAVEKPAEKPEASAAVAAKEEPAASPAKPQVEKPAEKAEASKLAAAPDKAQLEQAAKALAEAARREPEKKNAPKPKIVQAADLPVVEVTVKQHAYFNYTTGMSGDEQGVKFKVYAKHAKYSNIQKQSKTTGFEVIYRYRSKPDYVGKDSVELEYSDHQLGSGPDDPGTITKTLQVINITVEKKKSNP